MNRSLVLIVLGCLVVVGTLIALDVIPLGAGGGPDPHDTGGTTDPLEGEGDDGPAGTLKGRGTKDGVEGERDLLEAPPGEPSSAAQVRGTTPNGGSVRGRVVTAEGGVPLAGVHVRLGRPDSIIAYLRAKVNGRYDELRATTGGDGRFAFLDVTPSRGYVVRARHPDYAVASTPEPLDLRGRDAVDVGDLALGAGGGLRGRVLSAAKAPVAGARVVVTWRISNPLGVVLSDPETAPELEKETQTDESGVFVLETLEPGAKTLFVVAPDGANELLRSVMVETGAPKLLRDIVLPGAGFLAGTVVWASGEPIAGARVFAKPWSGSTTRTTETDAAGRFRIEWLPEGVKHGLGVLVEGMPIHMEQNTELGREDVRIEFPVPGTLEGAVVHAQGGDPVQRFFLELDNAHGPRDFMMRMLLTQLRRGLGPTPFNDPQGRFAFRRVAPGTYTVMLTAPGFPDVRKEAVTVTAGETTTITIEVPAGHVARGVVRRTNASPAAHARVYVVAAGVPEGIRPMGLERYTRDREPDAAAGADGRFVLPPQTPERYDLVATHPEALPGVLRGVDLRNGDAAGLEITLPPSGTVRGRLLDEHARPVKGEQVVVLYPDGVVRLVPVGDQGRFEAKGMPVGRCLVRWLSMRDAARHGRAIRQGDEEQKRTAYDDLRQDGGEQEVTDGGVVQVTLRMPRRVKVTGRVRGRDGEKAQEAFLNMPGAPSWIRIEPGPDGRFERELEPGTYQVWIHGVNSWTSIEVEIPDVPAYQVDLEAP